jgi:O-antigen/teichoic acid export membrane protein
MPQPQPNKRSQLARNVFYGVASWLLPIVPTLVATPTVISKLGNEQYGVLIIFLGFISYFFTTAIGKVAAKYAAEFLSTGEEQSVSPVISATLIVSTAAALVSTLAAAASAGFIVDEVLKIDGGLRDDAIVGVYLASATVLTTAAAQTFLLLLQALHRFDRYFLLANFTSVSFSVGGLALAWMGYGFLQILLWNLVTWILAGGIAALFVKRALPGFAFTFRIPKTIWLLVVRYAAGIVGYQLFGSVLLLFERGWIMRNLGAEALAFYVVPMLLAMYVHAFTASMVVSIFPTLNELLSEPEKLRTLYRHSTKLVLWLVVFAIITAAVCGSTFLAVWLNKDARYSEISSGPLVIHTITFSILALNTIAWHIAEGFRASSLNAYATLGWMVIGIVAIVFLGPRWSIEGVAIARLLGVLPFLPMILLIERRFLGGVEWRFWASSLAQLAIAATAASIIETLVIRSIGTGWFAFLVAVMAGALAYALGSLLSQYVSIKDLAGIKNFVVQRPATPGLES